MSPDRLFFLDDVCVLKDDSATVAIVERSHNDVDTHDSFPSHYASSLIDRHHRVPKPAFKRFCRDGIPPKDTVLVSWADPSKSQMVVPEKELHLVDRPLLNGDLVKKSTDSHMSGTVLRSIKKCDLKSVGLVREKATGRTLHANWYTLNRDRQSPFDIIPGNTLRDIPASELQYVQQYNEADMILYKNWIGRIRELSDEVTIRLLDGGVVVVKNELDLDPYDPVVSERFNIGDLVTTRKANLRTGRWVYGKYSPNTQPVGSVVDVRTVEVEVDWLECKIGSSNDEPPQFLGLDELDSGDVKLYDRTSRASTPPDNQSTFSTTDIELVHGVRVKFRDLTDACTRYDGSDEHGRIDRVDRKDTLGYDMNAFVVTNFSRDLVVQWQDLSITVESSTELIPDDAEDVNIVYPGEIICTQSHKCGPETDYTIKPDRVGIVQAVNPSDRIADVRWYPEARMNFIGDDARVPTSTLGRPAEETESVSLYDIRAPSVLNARRGDLVFVPPPTAASSTESAPHPDPTTSALNAVETTDWIGEVVDISLDGVFTIRLGAASTVSNIDMNADQIFIALRAEDEDWDDATDDDDISYIEDSEDEELTAAEESDMMALMQNSGADSAEASSEEEDGWTTDSDGDLDDEEESSQPTEARDSEIMIANGSTTESQDETPSTNHLLESSDPGTGPSVFPSNDDTPVASSSPHSGPPPYLLLEKEPPSDHRYRSRDPQIPPKQLRAVLKEHEILRKLGALPEGVYVQSWESRLDIFRVIIIGPTDTPYAMAPFIFDIGLPATYPAIPPVVHFHHWSLTDMPLQGRVNPNLYEDGNVCLSLLGTWSGDETHGESWVPGKSTVLQVIVSLLGLVLVREPYYNEAGYEVRQGHASARLPSILYNERVHLLSQSFIISGVRSIAADALKRAIGTEGVDEIMTWLYKDAAGPQLLKQAITTGNEIVQRSERPVTEGEQKQEGIHSISRGAALALKRLLQRMVELLG
ncbi:hypothetical protein MBLNU457_4216t3 [Dothideomycetes sp. NU457]